MLNEDIKAALQNEEEFVDLDLSVTKKKKFRFDRDNNRIVELNTSDMRIVGRLSEALPKLRTLQNKAAKLMDGISLDNDEHLENDFAVIGTRLYEIDVEMRGIIDELFGADVSAKAAPDGSMYDPFDGTYRFEHIIALLMSQYEANLKAEYENIERKMSNHIDKYRK